MAHQTKLKPCRVPLKDIRIHLRGQRLGKAGLAGAQAKGSSETRIGAIGNDDGSRPVALPPSIERPLVAIPLNRRHFGAIQQLGALGHGLLDQVMVELGALNNPERGITRQHGHHRILEAPGELHLGDHPIDGRLQIKGEPALHRRRHAATTGLGAGQRLGLQEQHTAATGRQVICRRCTGRTGADDGDIKRVGLAHTLRMSASFSARSFSISAMNLSVSF